MKSGFQTTCSILKHQFNQGEIKIFNSKPAFSLILLDHMSPCQCNILVCTISKKVVFTVHTTILHWQENPMRTYNIFHLQCRNCYLLSEYKPKLKQCRILCHLILWKLSKSAILKFWTIAGFGRKSYVVHTTILHKPENTKCRHRWRIRLYCTDTAM